MTRRAALVVAAILAGCASPPAAATPPPRAPAPQARAASDLGGPSGLLRARRQGLEIPLPDVAGWRVEPRTGSWLVATHAASSSSLFVRLSREEARVSRDACEAKARASRDLPARDGTILEERALTVPDDFDTHAVTLLAPPETGAPLRGALLAFGAAPHRCFAYAFATAASGDDAPLLVASRLATMLAASLLRVAATSDLGPPPTQPFEGRIGEPRALAWYRLEAR